MKKVFQFLGLTITDKTLDCLQKNSKGSFKGMSWSTNDKKFIQQLINQKMSKEGLEFSYDTYKNKLKDRIRCVK